MSTSAGVCHCPICLNNHSIDQFLVFPCGHGFCSNCTHQLFEQSRPKCPNCRVSIHRRDSHQVFLTVVDAKTALATSVVEGIELMGPSTPSGSVKRAEQKIRQVVESNPDSDSVKAILDALATFSERIVPMFKTVESQSKEISKLQEDLRRAKRSRDSMANKIKDGENLQQANNQLKQALEEAERNTHQAIQLAELAKDETTKHHDKMQEWKKRAAELDQENRRYKDLLDRQINSARTMKEKNKKLSKQISSLTEQINRKDAMSDATGDYDGDFSTHEHSRISNRLSIGGTPNKMSVTGTPSSARRSTYLDENDIDLDMSGIPQTKFQSDWQLNNAGTSNVLKKRSLNETNPLERRRVTNPIHLQKKAPASIAQTAFPISIDNKGHPTRPVQFGPRSYVPLGRHL
ncbi:hypothetical protein CVT24_011090 [Panaeolus cyanescens]|uniref:RING-type domain-containing protein n=1 Tax=Panaeolus cyanescens TaxID=181874 RepID=A0A409YVF5_9AGAR|nr:hypothetical protein CVT24_011090 [Panaeolus cyanescens]